MNKKISNHDRVFNNFESLKNAIRAKLPKVDFEFKNFLAAPEYGVVARHGHEWDKNCHALDFANDVLGKGNGRKWTRFDPRTYKVMAIGEAITAELMSGLVYNVSQLSISPACSAGHIHNLDNFCSSIVGYF